MRERWTSRRPEGAIVSSLWRVAAVGVLTAMLGGCADRMVELRYAADPTTPYPSACRPTTL